jgi:hypothetical protein
MKIVKGSMMKASIKNAHCHPFINTKMIIIIIVVVVVDDDDDGEDADAYDDNNCGYDDR